MYARKRDGEVCRVIERETCRGATMEGERREKQSDKVVRPSPIAKTPLSDFSTFRRNTREEKEIIAGK